MKILIAIVVTLFVFGIPLVVAQTETIEHLRRQMESMSACKKSLSDPKCNLDILRCPPSFEHSLPFYKWVQLSDGCGLSTVALRSL